MRWLVTLTAVLACGPVGCETEPASTSQEAVPQEQSPVRPSDGVTVMTWNLEWFYDEHRGDNFADLPKEQAAPSREAWNWRRDAVAARLASLQPTIAAFQEIENQRVLYYLTQAMQRNHQLDYTSAFIEGSDYYTEQDVGFVFDKGIDLVRIARHGQTRGMRQSSQHASVSKHAEVTYQIPLGEGATELLTIMNVHLRSRAQANAIRTRQARTAHAWLAPRIAAGENVILLGDFNTEETETPARPGTDMAAAMGLDTADASDDLIDLHQHLPSDQRRTHLLAGKQFDRILVSPSLLKDDPAGRDLVFANIRRVQSLAVQNGIDEPTEHWERYWQLPAADRDLSDHWPLLVHFDIR